jgi:hypothetical protein
MSYNYELDSIEYKGFTIRIINDENPEQPDWGDDRVFLVQASSRSQWRMGREHGHEDPHRYLEWGDGPWGEYDNLLRREKVKTPLDEWEDADDWEKRACWELYESWKDDHADGYYVWPLRAGDAHGPGTFRFSVDDVDEHYERADFWVFVEDTRTDVQRLADVGGERDVDPEQVRDEMLERYQQWANGDIWGYIIEDSSGEELDSCWGYYGSDDCGGQAKEAADHLAEKKSTRAIVALYEDKSWQSIIVQPPYHVGCGDTAKWAVENLTFDRKPLRVFNGDGGVSGSLKAKA